MGVIGLGQAGEQANGRFDRQADCLVCRLLMLMLLLLLLLLILLEEVVAVVLMAEESEVVLTWAYCCWARSVLWQKPPRVSGAAVMGLSDRDSLPSWPFLAFPCSA